MRLKRTKIVPKQKLALFSVILPLAIVTEKAILMMFYGTDIIPSMRNTEFLDFYFGVTVLSSYVRCNFLFIILEGLKGSKKYIFI